MISHRNKTGNINTFSTSVSKRIRRHVSHVLCHIINLSLRTGIFPDCLKLARGTLIPKGVYSSNAGNYRPISVLPIFSKIFEKVVYTHILNKIIYFMSNNMVLENVSLLCMPSCNLCTTA